MAATDTERKIHDIEKDVIRLQNKDTAHEKALSAHDNKIAEIKTVIKEWHEWAESTAEKVIVLSKNDESIAKWGDRLIILLITLAGGGYLTVSIHQKRKCNKCKKSKEE